MGTQARGHRDVGTWEPGNTKTGREHGDTGMGTWEWAHRHGGTGAGTRRDRGTRAGTWGLAQRDTGTWGHRDRDTGTGTQGHGDGSGTGLIVVWHWGDLTVTTPIGWCHMMDSRGHHADCHSHSPGSAQGKPKPPSSAAAQAAPGWPALWFPGCSQRPRPSPRPGVTLARDSPGSEDR